MCPTPAEAAASTKVRCCSRRSADSGRDHEHGADAVEGPHRVSARSAYAVKDTGAPPSSSGPIVTRGRAADGGRRRRPAGGRLGRRACR